MFKAGIDQEALVNMFAEGTAKQKEALREAVREATLKAMQHRELTIANIKKVLQAVTGAATVGAARNSGEPADVEKLLAAAVAGMDGALLQAVEANRRALQHFVEAGASSEKQFKAALASVEKMEDTFFATISTAAKSAGVNTVRQPWAAVLDAMKANGTGTGAQAARTVEEVMAQTRQAVRQGQAASAKAAQAMLEGYAALASGVLIGISQGIAPGGGSAERAEPKRKSESRAKRDKN